MPTPQGRHSGGRDDVAPDHRDRRVAAGPGARSNQRVIAPDALSQSAQLLLEAARSRTPCPPLRHALTGADIDDAYAIQQLVIGEQMAAGARVIGRKVGLTSPAVQRQMGVDQPDFGVLLSGTAYGDAEPIPHDRLLQPRVEAEVAFVLGTDLPDHRVTTADVMRATDLVVAAIEVVDSRIAGWDITILDTVADNASSGVFVLGGAPRRLTEIEDLRAAEMTVRRDGEEVSVGRGENCLGHPLNAVTWLANTMADRGSPLRAGEIVLSGALGPLVPAEAGRTYEARISGLGSVRACFT